VTLWAAAQPAWPSAGLAFCLGASPDGHQQVDVPRGPHGQCVVCLLLLQVLAAEAAAKRAAAKKAREDAALLASVEQQMAAANAAAAAKAAGEPPSVTLAFSATHSSDPLVTVLTCHAVGTAAATLWLLCSGCFADTARPGPGKLQFTASHWGGRTERRTGPVGGGSQPVAVTARTSQTWRGPVCCLHVLQLPAKLLRMQRRRMQGR
jgi:hypothetical protein